MLDGLVTAVGGTGGVGLTLAVQWLLLRGKEADARKAEAGASPTTAQLTAELAALRQEFVGLGARVDSANVRSDHVGADLRSALDRVEKVEEQVLHMHRSTAADQRDIGKMLAAIEGLHGTLATIQQHMALLGSKRP